MRPRRWILVGLCGVALGVVVVPRGLRAEDVDAIVSRGVEMRRQGRDADALVEFRRALQIQDTARIRAQAALAEQALGLWVCSNS